VPIPYIKGEGVNRKKEELKGIVGKGNVSADTVEDRVRMKSFHRRDNHGKMFPNSKASQMRKGGR
jgi:hypothetical protein